MHCIILICHIVNKAYILHDGIILRVFLYVFLRQLGGHILRALFSNMTQEHAKA
jgi:hypothetical protein